MADLPDPKPTPLDYRAPQTSGTASLVFQLLAGIIGPAVSLAVALTAAISASSGIAFALSLGAFGAFWIGVLIYSYRQGLRGLFIGSLIGIGLILLLASSCFAMLALFTPSKIR